MTATSFPEFNAAVTELTTKVSTLLGDVAAMQSIANVQVAVDKAAEASASATEAAASASASATSEGAAATFKNAAETAATNSADSASASATFANKAGQWADAGEDVAVETGKYSAKHHATKASASATSAAASADIATQKTIEILGKAEAAAASASEASASASGAAEAEARALLHANQHYVVNRQVTLLTRSLRRVGDMGQSLHLDFVGDSFAQGGRQGLNETLGLTAAVSLGAGEKGRFNEEGVFEWGGRGIEHVPVTGEAKGLLIEEQRTNLLTYSNRFANWSPFGVTLREHAALAPDGTATATEITFVNVGGIDRGIRRSASATLAGQAFTGALWLKGTVPAGLYLRVSTTESDHARNMTQVDLGGTYTEWTRVTVTRTFPTDTAGTGVQLRIIAPGPSAATGAFLIWQGQIEAGSFPTSHIPTPATFTGRASTATYFDANGVLKIAAADEARYTHAYIDGKWVSAGLLLEEQRTNLLTYSSDFANAWWIKTDASVGAGAAVSPDGTATAAKLIESATNASHTLHRSASVTAGNIYTFSVFLKRGERKYALVIGIGDLAGLIATVDLDTGAISDGVAEVTNVGNGWFRVSITTPANVSGGPTNIYIAPRTTSGGGASAYQGDGTSGIYVWGAQLEQASSPSSYIPTTTAQVTRAADTSTSSQVTRLADTPHPLTTSWYRTACTWELEVADCSGLPGLLVFGDSPVIRNVSGSGRLVLVQQTPSSGDVYVDGELIYSITPFHGVEFTPAALLAKATGGEGQSSGTGLIKLVRVHPHTMSAAEVAALGVA